LHLPTNLVSQKILWVIPNPKETRTALEDNFDATTLYFDNTIAFQKIALPYSDNSNSISVLFFYEETFKALQTYNNS